MLERGTQIPKQNGCEFETGRLSRLGLLRNSLLSESATERVSEGVMVEKTRSLRRKEPALSGKKGRFSQ
jgi:hypothetical protein